MTNIRNPIATCPFPDCLAPCEIKVRDADVYMVKCRNCDYVSSGYETTQLAIEAHNKLVAAARTDSWKQLAKDLMEFANHTELCESDEGKDCECGHDEFEERYRRLKNAETL